MKRINCHLGPVPPPLGGISIYLKRLNQNFGDLIYDDFKFNLISFLLYIIRNSHRYNYVYHTPNNRRRILLGILSKLGIVHFDLYVHGNSLNKNFNYLEKLLLKNSLKKAKSIYVVGGHIKSHLEKYVENVEKIIEKPAFIPPNISEEHEVRKYLPRELDSFMSSHSKNILINGSSFVISKNTDLYGFDLAIRLISKIFQLRQIKVGLIIAVADSSNEAFYTVLRQLAISLNVNSQIFWITNQKEIWPIFKDIDAFIRPTNEDGYGISIDEAIY